TPRLKGQGFHLPQGRQYFQGSFNMLHSRKTMLASLIRPRMVAAAMAASVLIAGGVTEASAGSRNHHRHHHHKHHGHHAKSHGASGPSWKNANASLKRPARSSRSFSGVASYY